MIFLSVITINKNNLQGLKKTIESVCRQTQKSSIEFIVIDGDSSDGSKTFIDKVSEGIDYYVSEKDSGIYQAMNKGIQNASGKYIQFLNSGDVYSNNFSLEAIMQTNPTEDIIYTDYTDAGNGNLFRMPSELSFRFFYKQSLNHQASIIKRSLFLETEFYNEGSPIIADWEFFIKSIILHGATTKYIPLPLISFDFVDSTSNKPENIPKIKHRRNEVLQQYFPLLVRDMEYIDALEQSNTYQLLRRLMKLKSFFFK